ncbi:MAG: hypothetical protein RRB13_14485 [bacterium]|nr:hypothetical protein [bacterium]
MTITITESGMDFGPYPKNDVFHIEQSQTFKKLKGVQIGEFVLLRGGKLLFIEAKSSSPRPETHPDFQTFIAEIHEKLANSLTLSVAALLKRHGAANSELPPPIRGVSLSQVEFLLILVLPDHPDKALAPIRDALGSSLRAFCNIWSPAEIVVLNRQSAQNRNLII